GQWWVQDAAAALPVRLFGDIKDKKVADLCAAPGGKTAQLALAGAQVTAVDRSPARVARLRENLTRLALQAETVVADAAEWPAEAASFDGILVDAPCTSTGTIRRHPDVAWLRQEGDIAALSALQKRLLLKATHLLKPGGTLSEVAGLDDIITADGDLRTLPSHLPNADPRLSGLDGFYAARLVKRISTLIAGRFARSMLARASGSTVALSRLWPGRTDRLIIAPHDLRTADATRAAE
ncbi:RNA (C5-cytosine) methyltransferase like protein, partial [Aduncisulcus paluster]